MTVAVRAAGTPTLGSAAVTSINPSAPAGWQSGDISILVVSVKPDTAYVATPANWTKLSEHKGGTGTQGADTGATKTVTFYRTTSPAAPGNISFTGASSAAAVIHIFSKDSTKNWAIGDFTTGADTSHGTAYSATGARALGLTTGDLLLTIETTASDAGTISSESISATGATLGAFTIRSQQQVTTGNDCKSRVLTSPVTAGTDTAAPVHSYTSTASTSGHTAFLRLSEKSGTRTDFTTGGATTWTCPAGVTTVEVECIGSGAAGRGTTNLTQANVAGGGGGAYSRKTVSVVPDTVYDVYVGVGSAGVSDPGVPGEDGESSWFINTSTVLAEGGKGSSGGRAAGSGGAGGLASNSIGDVKYDGEAGNTDEDAAGGDAASGGTIVGGDGGRQPSGDAAGASGGAPGAGGSGGRTSALGSPQSGGNGADGQVRITVAQVVNHTADVSQSGTGSTVATAVKVIAIAASLAGTGAVSADSMLSKGADSSISGTGSTSTSAYANYSAETSTSATGDASATANASLNAEAVVSGTGSNTTEGARSAFAESDASGAGSVSAAATLSGVVDANAEGVGSTTSSALKTLSADSTISATGSTTSGEELLKVAEVSILGVGSADVDSLALRPIDSTVSGSGEVDSDLTLHFTVHGSNVVATGSSVASASMTRFADTAVSGSGSTDASGILVRVIDSSLSGFGESTADAIIDGENDVNASGTGSTNASASLQRNAQSEAIGSGAASADFTLNLGLSASASGSGSATTEVGVNYTIEVISSGVGSVNPGLGDDSSASGQGDVNAGSSVNRLANVILNGIGSVLADRVPDPNTSEGEGEVDAGASVKRSTQASITGVGAASASISSTGVQPSPAVIRKARRATITPYSSFSGGLGAKTNVTVFVNQDVLARSAEVSPHSVFGQESNTEVEISQRSAVVTTPQRTTVTTATD